MEHVSVHLPHGKTPLRVEQLHLILDQLLEFAHDQIAFLLDASVERH